MWLRFLLSCLLCAIFLTPVSAQDEVWPSPEVEQLYQKGKISLSKGYFEEAILLFRQAAQLAPGVAVLYRDLGQALLLARKPGEAVAAIMPIIERGSADEQTYQIAAAALTASGNTKKARTALEQGLKRYPGSGLLYHESGKTHERNGDLKKALAAWLSGIERDPGFHLNYYNAATSLARLDQPLWALLYGEIFINMERQTPRSNEVRALLIDSYRKLFVQIGSQPGAGFGSVAQNRTAPPGFEQAAMQTFISLSPVVSDGISIENLVMLRTRFAMEWARSYASRFPHSLFVYHDRMLREGRFEAYNQWLLGKAADESQHQTWIQFHKAAIPDFEQWAQTNKLQLSASDYYTLADLDRLFRKKRK